MNIIDIEKSVYSQNGEDGIIEFLVNRLNSSNKILLEIGCANGKQNNSSYLCDKFNYTGLVIDGKYSEQEYKSYTKQFSNPPKFLKMMIEPEMADIILKELNNKEPDFFSLDIDGIDYYITKELFDRGFRPKIIVVEYNSSFGPEKNITIKYERNFDRKKNKIRLGSRALHKKMDRSRNYYGTSIMAWKKFFSRLEYKFLTVESNGTNAFFINPKYIEIPDIETIYYKDNVGMKKIYGTWNELLPLYLKTFDLIQID